MAQQDTDQQHGTCTAWTTRASSIDTTDAEERETAYRERGTSRPITVVGNPVLHKECKDVTEFDDELDQLIDDMFASQRTAEGVGLAANQIGVDLKVFVYDCPDDEGVRHVGRRLQPGAGRAARRAPVLDDCNEGCLSVPDARTPRWPAPTTPRSPARTPRATRSRSRAPATSRAACSTRPTTCTATSTSTGSPSGTARTRCGRWPRTSPATPSSPTTDVHGPRTPARTASGQGGSLTRRRRLCVARSIALCSSQ